MHNEFAEFERYLTAAEQAAPDVRAQLEQDEYYLFQERIRAVRLMDALEREQLVRETVSAIVDACLSSSEDSAEASKAFSLSVIAFTQYALQGDKTFLAHLDTFAGYFSEIPDFQKLVPVIKDRFIAYDPKKSKSKLQILMPLKPTHSYYLHVYTFMALAACLGEPRKESLRAIFTLHDEMMPSAS